MDPTTLTALDAMVVGDALAELPRGVQATVLGLTVGTGLWAAARPRPAALAAFVACALLWSRANAAFEGRVLWTFSPGHGLTVADLLPPALTALILGRVRRENPLIGTGSGGILRVVPQKPRSPAAITAGERAGLGCAAAGARCAGGVQFGGGAPHPRPEGQPARRSRPAGVSSAACSRRAVRSSGLTR